MTCRQCKQRPAGPAREILFVYGSFPVKILKDVISCAHCAKSGWMEAFEKFKEFFILSGKQPVVDWQRYYAGDRLEYREKMILALAISFGILSYNAAGNWEIVVGELITNLNPHSFGGKIFFVYFEDALAYAKSEYPNTNYGWEIRRISEVIPKNIALAMAQTV